MELIKLDIYTDIKAHPKLAAILLEILKRLETQFSNISVAPRCKHIFKDLSVKELSLNDLCEAALCSGELITVAVENDHYGVIFDYRRLDHTDLFATLEDAIQPKGRSWEIWVKLATYLAYRPCKIFSESHINRVIQDSAAQGYDDFHDRNPSVRKIKIDGQIYYVYMA
jgi:hypothetical protein